MFLNVMGMKVWRVNSFLQLEVITFPSVKAVKTEVLLLYQSSGREIIRFQFKPCIDHSENSRTFPFSHEHFKIGPLNQFLKADLLAVICRTLEYRRAMLLWH